MFDDPNEEEILVRKDIVLIDKNILVPIESLEFRYGEIAFKYELPDLKTQLEFEIENESLRPEFEVLKPYFSKVLQSRNIATSIHSEFENGIIISQLATSDDIEKLNREIIEGVRFRYFSKTFLGKLPYKDKKDNLLDFKQLQSEGQLYDAAEEILGDILNHKQFKHSKYLRFLANKHE